MAREMKIVNVELTGIAPILFNRFTEEAAEKLDKGSRGKKMSRSERIEESYGKVYRSQEGYLGVPMNMVKKAMRVGCSFAGMKVGRRGAEPFIRAVVHLDRDFVEFEGQLTEPDGIHECSGRIPPKTGAIAIIRRPFLNPGWKLQFSLYIADERVTPGMVREALEEAGVMAAIGDHRPEYGRFIVSKFENGKEAKR